MPYLSFKEVDIMRHIRMHLRLICSSFVCLWLSSCDLSDFGDGVLFSLGGTHPAHGKCSYHAEQEYADYVYAHCVMRDTYLWYQHVPDNLAYQNYATVDEFVADLREPTFDHFSFVTDGQSANNYYNQGLIVGDPGVRVVVIVDGENSYLWVYRSYLNSSAYQQGIRRGNRIHAINNKSIYQMWINVRDHQSDWISEFDFSSNESNLVEFTDNQLIRHSKEIDIAAFDLQTIDAVKAVQLEDQSMGMYFAFNGFVSASAQQISDALSQFDDQSTEFAIVDLRGNSGGFSYIANQLTSILGGHRLQSLDQNDPFSAFKRSIFNDKYAAFDDFTPFYRTAMLPHPIAEKNFQLQRIVFLIDNASCSASELVINSLHAFAHLFEIHVIGKPSCGKPYGMFAKNFGDKSIYAVEYKLANAQGFGDYGHGINVDCYVDDLATAYDWGDTQDPMLTSAINWLNSGNCQGSVENNEQKMFKAATEQHTTKETIYISQPQAHLTGSLVAY